MSVDEKILNKILEIQKSTKLDFILSLDSKDFPLKNVEITKSSVPVNRPTNRGGVYYTDTFVFKIKSRVNDFSITSLLSKSMLGPSADFQDLQISTNAQIEGSNKKIIFFVHLTNSMQSSSYVELNSTLVKIQLH